MGASAGLMHPLRESGMDFMGEELGVWNGNEHFLSREVLAGFQQKSGGEISRKRSFSRNTRFTIEKEKELPQQTQDFLRKVGIEESSSVATTGDVARSSKTHNLQKTKLVGHIFECLNALQQLVALDQDNEEATVEDTQSVCDRNTKSVGKLIHELVTIYGLCGESLKVLLDSQPAAAAVEDTAGRLPLHVAVDKHKPWLRLVDTLVAAYPDACKARDGGGRLPIHIAVDRNNPSIEVVKVLLTTYPDAVGMRRGVGRLPIHYAVFYDQPNLEVVQYLLDAYPTGASLVDVYGRLPLHYAVDRARPKLDVVKTLLDCFPDGVFAKDTLSRVPLTIALDHGDSMSVDIIQALVAANPESVKDKGPLGRLPLRVAVDVPKPSLACVRFLARKYPAAITEAVSLDGRDAETTLEACRARALVDLERELLMVCPDLDRDRLRDINWSARRIAIIISIPRKVVNRSFSPQSKLVSAMSTELPSPESPVSATACRGPEIIVSMEAHTPGSDGGGRNTHLRSPAPYSEWDYEHKEYVEIQTLYNRLYARNEDLWRLMVTFL